MKSKTYIAKQLNRRQFASVLQKGLGRAYLHINHYGLDNVADLVLKACLHNQAYDPQSEGSKGKWLFTMFHNTKYYPEFSEAILKALRTNKDTWDLQQLFELAKEMALNGDECAKAGVREHALQIASKPSVHDWLGAQEWIELGGVEGTLELTRIYGRRLLANPEDFVPEKEAFPGGTISRKYKNILAKHAHQEPAIKAYFDHIERGGNPSRQSSTPLVIDRITKQEAEKRRCERIRQEYSLDGILWGARNKKGDYPSHYMQFGRCAAKKELEAVYSAFLTEKDNDVRLRLLWVFRRTRAPRLDEDLLVLANGEDERLKEAALNALGQIKNPRVHKMAKQKVISSKLLGTDTDVLRLFINNYDPDDSKLITSALSSIKPNRDDAHDLVWHLVEIAEQQHDVGLVDALTWGYEKTPCSNCRYRIVVQLDILKHFNGDILHECQYDAYEDIAMLARKRLTLVMAEDAEDIAAFEERLKEPLISYDEMVKRLK